MNIFDPTTLVGIHSLLSVGAMASGVPVLIGLLRGQGRPRWTRVFLATAVATSVTGFGLPAPGFLPSHGVGVLSLIALGAAIAARYRFHLGGAWRRVYAVGIVAAEYFLVFVGIAQAFLKVPVLAHAAAASQMPFAISQLATLVAFALIGWACIQAPRVPVGATP